MFMPEFNQINGDRLHRWLYNHLASGIFHSSSRISAAKGGQVPSHKLKASNGSHAGLVKKILLAWAP